MNELNQPMTFKYEMEKVATYQMPTDSNVWDEEVLKHLHDEHPELTEENFEVVFKKTDAKKGYGYGFVAMGKEGAVKIPIIIKEYQMYPLDVFLYEKQAAPLNAETIKEIVTSTELGKVTPKPEEPFAYVGPNITDRVYPGLYSTFRPGVGGRVSSYKYASALGVTDAELNELTVRLGGQKYASLLAEIGVSADQAKTFKEKLEKDAQAVMAWSKSPMKEILKKAAVPTEEPKVNPDVVSPGSAHPLVDALIVRKEPAAGWGPITNYGRYVVQGTSGLEYGGEVFPVVVDFDLNKQDIQIFSGGILVKPPNVNKPYQASSCSAVQAAIAGKPEEPYLPRVSEGETPSCGAYKGATGFFYFKKGSAVVAFIPVTVLSKTEMHETRDTSFFKDGQNMNIRKNFVVTKLLVRDSFGRNYTIMITPQAINVQRVGDLVMMPYGAQFKSISSKLVSLRSDPAQTKLASTAVKTVLVRSLGSDSFSVDADWTSAWAKEGDRREKIASYLGGFYTKESVDKVLDAAKTEGRVAICDRAPEAKAEVNKYEGAEKIARDLTKIAAELPDPALVDTVLSLQFINKDNVNKFISFLPQLEKVAGNLADLLIASRIGLGMDEYPIKTAMENVMEVIMDLRMLKGK